MSAEFMGMIGVQRGAGAPHSSVSVTLAVASIRSTSVTLPEPMRIPGLIPSW
jgi:hypothetical protein